jgi:hypothetical protein
VKLACSNLRPLQDKEHMNSLDHVSERHIGGHLASTCEFVEVVSFLVAIGKIEKSGVRFPQLAISFFGHRNRCRLSEIVSSQLDVCLSSQSAQAWAMMKITAVRISKSIFETRS